MMRLICAALYVVAALPAIGRCEAAEELIVGQPTVAAVQVIDPEALAVHQYFYVDFARRLQAAANARTLVEAEVKALEMRVNSYRPFRSFHQYAATYTADVGWQLELLAARQRLACLANAEADLWRERQMVAIEAASAAK